MFSERTRNYVRDTDHCRRLLSTQLPRESGGRPRRRGGRQEDGVEAAPTAAGEGGAEAAAGGDAGVVGHFRGRPRGRRGREEDDGFGGRPRRGGSAGFTSPELKHGFRRSIETETSREPTRSWKTRSARPRTRYGPS